MSQVRIAYYSDILCIWAYAAQQRVDRLAEVFGEQIAVEAHYCSVFPDAWSKISAAWAARGGFEGFNAHVNEVAARFPHVEVSDRLWLDVRPRTSASAHLFVKAVEIIEREDAEPVTYAERLSTRAAWALRRAFFAEARDISDWHVHARIAAELGIDYAQVDARIRSSEAVAGLAMDYNLAQKDAVSGSPMLIMNEGRQRLFGNVGYRLIEANVQELLRKAAADEMSWC